MWSNCLIFIVNPICYNLSAITVAVMRNRTGCLGYREWWAIWAATKVNRLDRIVTDNQGRKLRLLEPKSLTSAPKDFHLSRVSRPFRRYFSLVANSLIMVFLVQAFSAQLIGVLEAQPLYVIGCSFVTFPCIGFLIFLHRPKLIEVRLLTTDENGESLF